MTIAARLFVFALVLGTAACARVETGANGEHGGPREAELLAATVVADLARVQRALGAGADPNRMVPLGGHLESPWRYAIHRAGPVHPAFVPIAQAMLRAQADPAVAWGEAPSIRGGYSEQRSFPVYEAVQNGSAAVLQALLDAGLPRAACGQPLVLAVENDQRDLVHVLVEAGVDVNDAHTSPTPLVAAVEHRNLALMNYLEEHGAREKP